ncbi:peptidase inhibitor family I36 protein [Spirillospora sp. NPDC052269]
MRISIGRLASTAVLGLLVTAPGAAQAALMTPAHAVPAAAVTASDGDCPDLTFCVWDAEGHAAHYRHGADDVRAQGLTGPAVRGWNRTQSTWCIYERTKMNDTDLTAKDAKVPAGDKGGTGFGFLSLQPEHIFHIC